MAFNIDIIQKEMFEMILILPLVVELALKFFIPDLKDISTKFEFHVAKPFYSYVQVESLGQNEISIR